MDRSLREHLSSPNGQAMYAIIHGGTDADLRYESIDFAQARPFDGYAIGGSLGKDRAEMLGVLDVVMPRLPNGRPTHLLGIADPESVPGVVARGVDTFDSCYPTRVARHGNLMTTRGMLKLTQTSHSTDFGPIDAECPSIPHSRAYLHHLLKAREPLYFSLASLHNLIFMNTTMQRVREKILRDEI